MLIDVSYFVADLNIPNTGQQDVSEKLEWLINKHEPDLLTMLLGYELYSLFKDAVSVDPIEPRFQSLKNGAAYQDCYGNTVKWMGIAPMPEPGSVFKQSLVANYVYWHWQKSMVTQSVGIGEAATTAENAVMVSPGLKMIRAYNEMVDWVRELYRFIDSHQSDYPELDYSIKYCALRQFYHVNQFGI